MRFTFRVEVEVDRMEGKFARRDELGDQLIDAIDCADPGELEGEAGGQYTVSSWTVTVEP